MEIWHDDKDLESMESDPDYSGKWGREIVRSFRKVLILLRGIGNETGIYQFKSLRFEKLKGRRKHQRSIRLNDQWRLILEIEKNPDGGNRLVIKGIEDYH